MNKLLKNKYIRFLLKLLKVQVPPLILCIGDSLTRGSPNNTGYPEHLGKITQSLCINSGNPGEASNTTDYRFADELQKYKPDIVLICIGTNDFNLGIQPEYTKAYIQSMCLKAKEADVQPVVIAVPDYASVGIPISKIKDHSMYDTLFSSGTHVISHALALVMLEPDLRSDDVHLNKKGYEKLAEKIASNLKNSGVIR